MVNCTACGNLMNEAALFCPKCGERIGLAARWRRARFITQKAPASQLTTPQVLRTKPLIVAQSEPTEPLFKKASNGQAIVAAVLTLICAPFVAMALTIMFIWIPVLGIMVAVGAWMMVPVAPLIVFFRMRKMLSAPSRVQFAK